MNATRCPSCRETVGADSKHCEHCGAEVDPAAARSTSAADELDGLKTIVEREERGPRAKEIPAGTVFDRRFVIERVIGRGGMGVVYRAKDQVTSDPVALKLIHPYLLESPAMAERFLREGKLTRSLRHPNIVSVFDVHVAGGAHYLSMECLEGMSLRLWLARNLKERRTVSLGLALALGREIASGVAAAHAAGVIHRDLKPENVVLLREPSDAALPAPGQIKVLDFGIARAVASQEQLTQAGGSLGTPAYMAPEQETSADAVGPEADVYALGAIFYEILLGVPPRGRFELPSKVRPELRKAIDELCEKALSAHPARRFRDASELVAAIRTLENQKTERADERRDAGGFGKLGEYGKDLVDRLKENQAATTFPKSVGQWLTLNAIPCLAFVPWFLLWRRTKAGKHLGYAALYAFPLLSLTALGEEASVNSGRTLTYDSWGNPLVGEFGGAGADGETLAGLAVIVLGLWIAAIVHAHRNRALIESLRN